MAVFASAACAADVELPTITRIQPVPDSLAYEVRFTTVPKPDEHTAVGMYILSMLDAESKFGISGHWEHIAENTWYYHIRDKTAHKRIQFVSLAPEGEVDGVRYYRIVGVAGVKPQTQGDYKYAIGRLLCDENFFGEDAGTNAYLSFSLAKEKGTPHWRVSFVKRLAPVIKPVAATAAAN